MKALQKHKLAFVSITYWFLLLYIIAALLWWFIALNNQNITMAKMSIAEISTTDPEFDSKINNIEDYRKRKTTQYLGEGITFFIVIMVGAVFIFRATRRQIKFSESQQNFMMAVTHELKTPIAITQLNLETIQKRSLSEELREKMINDSLKEVARLNNLCNNSLWAAQLDAGAYVARKEKICLSEIVNNYISKYQKSFTSFQFQVQIQHEVYVESDILMMEILINNLLENVTKYAPKNSVVNISLIRENSKVMLTVADQGMGIPDDEKQAVFEKFYRSKKALKSTTGSGLGLFLCKKIMQKHQGDIFVTDNNPTGSIFKAIFNHV
ncbi:MAG: HAMP domain-containing histidine kinase [Chitinophagaceae bacterium]|nr:HAMP domain-containing histidine kinase [Chitinophagaceae bacterium]